MDRGGRRGKGKEREREREGKRKLNKTDEENRRKMKIWTGTLPVTTKPSVRIKKSNLQDKGEHKSKATIHYKLT